VDNHKTDDCRAIAKFKQQKKSHFEAKAGPGKKSLTFHMINALKRQLKPEKTASSKSRKNESLISTEIKSKTSSDEGENKEYFLLILNPFVLAKLS
jgi:hypothetical protein